MHTYVYSVYTYIHIYVYTYVYISITYIQKYWQVLKMYTCAHACFTTHRLQKRSTHLLFFLFLLLRFLYITPLFSHYTILPHILNITPRLWPLIFHICISHYHSILLIFLQITPYDVNHSPLTLLNFTTSAYYSILLRNQALEMFEEATTVDVSNEEAHNALAIALLRAGLLARSGSTHLE